MIQRSDQIECPYCKIHVLESNFITHEAQCWKIIKAKKQEQGILNLKDSILKNKSTGSKAQESVQCPQCDQILKFSELDEHENSCPNRLILCYLCREMYPKNLMQFHYECCPNKNNPLQDNNTNNTNNNNTNTNTNQRRQSKKQIFDQEIKQYEPKLIQALRLDDKVPKQIKHQKLTKNNTQNYQSIRPDFQQLVPKSLDDSFLFQQQHQQPQQQQEQIIQQQKQPKKQKSIPTDKHFEFNDKTKDKKQIKKMNAQINKILDQGGDISQFMLEDHDMTNVGGVKKNLMEQLPVIQFDENQQIQDEENKKCCICMNEFIHEEKLLLLPCIHRFHNDCIGYWITKNPTCPLCHKDINKFF